MPYHPPLSTCDKCLVEGHEIPMAACHDVRVDVRYTVFGEVAVSVDGVRQPLTRRRERDVLAVLLAAQGGPVAAERLLAEVWGPDSPRQSLGSLQVTVSRLRGLLEPGRTDRKGTRLVSTTAGYSLIASVADVDAWGFAAHAEQALTAGTAHERLDLCDQARSLWAGQPYADTESPVVRSEVARLEELWLTILEQRARTLLDLGRPEEALGSLTALAPQHPWRERLWSLLALAQYQCSRQVEALETLRDLRERLAEELGIDPSMEVRHLEESVLRQDPSLLARPPALARPEPGPAPRFVAPREPSRSATTASVGRPAALSEAIRLLSSDADTPTPRFLLVAGEPGIGKSRLVADLAEVAESSGVRVLLGNCHEGDFAPALWPWLGIVRALHGAGSPDPWLDPLLDDEITPTPPSGDAGLRMFDSVLDLLERAATQQPLLLVLEDIHWADDSSLALLRHLAGSERPAPIGVVCTRRTTEVETTEALIDTMAALARAGAERMRLDGLDAAAVSALLEPSVGPRSSQLGPMVADITGGNPFFVLQYARLLATLRDVDDIDPSALPIPDGVRDVVRQRLGRLPGEATRTLIAAAVLGHHIDPDLVAELTDTSVDACLDTLDLALASGLVEERAAGYAFVHALAREVTYAELSTARRMRLHDRASRILEEHVAHGADATAEIAYHAHLAAPLSAPHAERACEWLARAAAVATARHAHPEALELWQQVLLDSVPDSPTSAEAMCGVAVALLRMARTVEARATVERAIRLARNLGRSDLVARAVGVLNTAGVWSWREHGVMDEPFVALLREALDQVTDSGQRAQILATLQVELYYGWDSEEADRVGRESVELARHTGHRDLLIEILLVRLIAAWGPSRAAERLVLIDELIAQGPVGVLELFTQFQQAVALYESFQPSRSDEVMRACASRASELRHTGLEIPLAWWRYARARDLDEPDASALGERALALHRSSGYIAFLDLEILAAIRLSVDGEKVPDWAVEKVSATNPGLRALVAHALLETREPERARAVLGLPAPPGATEYSVLAGHCLRVAVLAETGTGGEVREALDRITPYAGNVVTYGSVDHLGVVDHFLALGYAALGDARALEHAHSALEGNTRIQCAPWRRRSEALIARLS